MAGPCRIPKLTVRVRFPSPAPQAKSVAIHTNWAPCPNPDQPVSVSNISTRAITRAISHAGRTVSLSVKESHSSSAGRPCPLNLGEERVNCPDAVSATRHPDGPDQVVVHRSCLGAIGESRSARCHPASARRAGEARRLPLTAQVGSEDGPVVAPGARPGQARSGQVRPASVSPCTSTTVLGFALPYRRIGSGITIGRHTRRKIGPGLMEHRDPGGLALTAADPRVIEVVRLHFPSAR
jgi:hypothetical protein